MPGSPSTAPSRTPTIPSPSGSPLYTWPPQCSQNDFGCPFSGRQVRIASAPATSVKAPAGTIPFIDHGTPLRFWQRLQWQ